MRKLVLVLFVVVLAVSAFGQNKHETAKRVERTNAKLKPIETYVETIDEFVTSFDGPHQVVADFADFNKPEKPKWVSFDSQAAYENDQRESYTTAFIWKKDGKVVRVNFTYSSPSGDWAQYVFQTFYPDGKLARADRELRTFMGDIIVNRVLNYGADGKLVGLSIAYRDLETQEPIKAPDSFQDMDVDIYMKTSDLPFISHLKVKKN